MKTSRKVDGNHAEIVADLRKAGYAVLDLSQAGKGIPDIAVLVGQSQAVLFEIKNPATKGKLNALQKKWHAEWKGQVDVIYKTEEALAVIARIKRMWKLR